MPKLTKKLVVYLDQNFISEMAKADINSKVKPEFTTLFNLLHQGFKDEKLVVPRSFFHDVETSLAPPLQDAIRNYQSYLGQTELHPQEYITIFQTEHAAKQFLGEDMRSLDYSFAYPKNPDNIIERFDIRVNSNWDLLNFTNSRIQTREELEKLQKEIILQGITLKKERERQVERYIEYFLQYEINNILWLFKQDRKKAEEFIQSQFFKQMPHLDISSQMWSKILVQYKNRSIKSGDATDINVISTYLPYVDVLAVDSFMADRITELQLDQKYETKIFDSSTEGLNKFINFISEFLSTSEPVNKPEVSIYVFSDKEIKEDSFEFFKELGLQAMGRHKGWVELFAFDDGNMPEYKIEFINETIPFCGLQDFHIIKIVPSFSQSDILELCKKNCRSDQFLLIDKHRRIPENFIKTLIDYCKSGKDRILNFSIYKR